MHARLVPSGIDYRRCLVKFKRSYPEISEAFLRSDNAGCYHCAPLMLSIPGISKRTGIEIRRYDFSDAQSGKYIWDRRIACAKSHIRRFLNEGNNINTASDMKKALDSYGGVKGCRASVVSIDRTKQQIAKHKWTGITLFNNFEFLKSGIKVRKAYKIGKGKLIKKADIKQMACTQGATGLISQEAFTIPENDKGLLKKTTVKQCQEKRDKDDVQTQHTSKGFNCPDVSCVKVFVSNGALERHLDVGKHLYRLQTESAYDVVKQKWASKCTTVGIHTETNKHSTGELKEETGEADQSPVAVKMGWALKKSTGKVRFSKPIKDLLLRTFIDGEKSGIKADPKEVAARIRCTRNGKKKVFDRSEWLSVQQVKSYFSRLSVLQRKGILIDDNEEEQNEEVEMIEEEIRRHSLLDCGREEVEL